MPGVPQRVPPARAVEAILESLLRAPGQLARNPRVAIRGAVKQLLALGGARAAAVPEAGGRARTYRIDELARVSGATARNIRAYQERGLLHPPTRVGRTAVFDDTHLARLTIIMSMLDRGYTGANILEMLTAWERGIGLGEVLGLEGVLVPPRPEDQPVTVSLPEARAMAGGRADLDLLVEARLVEVTGNRARILRPQLLDAFAEMREHGMDTASVLAVHQKVLPSLDQISQVLVKAGAAHVAEHFTGDAPPTSDEIARLVTMLTRFRALAMASVAATLAASIEETIEDLLADYLADTVVDGATASAEALPG
ncbi:MerR family transcriptional regulator [Nocardioides psychrotolerans]|uniref:MerR family transcriptional regulator n=1 Tax=Nocardioides psychrotolerans TaxID=1005945 RepID=UPI0031380848